MIRLTLTLLVACAPIRFCPIVRADERATGVYDQLYDAIMSRFDKQGDEIGLTSAEPLIWYESDHLLKSARAEKLLQAMDDFSALSEDEIEQLGSIRRALLQSHLWAVFDWAAQYGRLASKSPSEEQRAIQKKAALLIPKVALTQQQILELPDTYQATAASRKFSESPDPDDAFAPFFPAELYQPDGDWVCLRRTRYGAPAETHGQSKDWRSAFSVFMRTPGGRGETLAYLQQLNDFRPRIVDADRGLELNPKTPQFPNGTQFALAEHLLLITDEGKLVRSPLTAQIQVRAYLNAGEIFVPGFSTKRSQAVAEFVIQPKLLFKGQHVMKAVAHKAPHYATFFSNDPFMPDRTERDKKRSRGLANCMVCHSSKGILSVNSRAAPNLGRIVPVRFRAGDLNAGAGVSIAEKKKNYTWGLLQGLWSE